MPPVLPAVRPRLLRRSRVALVVVGVVAFGVGAAAGAAGGEDGGGGGGLAAAPAVTVTDVRTETVAPPGPADAATTATTTTTTTATATVTVTAPPEAGRGGVAAGAGVAGDGTYLVGQDIEPGTYRSTGSTLCYWERARNASGELSAIIANDNARGTATVTIAASDKVFKTRRCGEWTRIG